MPDLMTHTTRTCSSNVHWTTEVAGSGGKTYTVTWGFQPFPAVTQYGWSCTCHSYKYGRGKPCKHIQQVEASKARCAWNWEFDLVADAGACPCCGGPTEVMQVAV